MIFERLRRFERQGRGPSPPRAEAALYDTAVAQARSPALYAAMGAPDTAEGRFELLTLHVILLIERLKDSGDGAAAGARQGLFDIYIRNLDGALREMGVGDLAVGKRMKALGKIFYGRAAGYEAAFKALPDRSELEGLIGRTILEGAGGDRGALADYVLACRQALASAEAEALMAGSVAWPRI